MVLLSSMTNTMVFETRNLYANACKRNLTASAKLWAKQNSEKITDIYILDVNAMDIPNARVYLAPESNSFRVTVICRNARIKK